MTFPETKTAKSISITILVFFLWTFCGLFDIAYAAKNGNLTASNSDVRRQDRNEENKLEDILERIRNAEERIQGKIQNDEAIDEEEQEIEREEAELEKQDTEIRQKFRDNEDKIKDLPEEIKQRHRDFVQKYEENYSRFKANINDIKKARTKAEKHEAHQKTQAFLKKTKPPKRHPPLNPHKLPHRTPEPKKVDLQPWTLEKKNIKMPKLLKKAENQEHTPLLVAANGSLTGLLEPKSQLAENSTIQLAMITPEKRAPVTEADLAETTEVQFTPAIRAKAEELGNKPVKIYNWVRNNIEYVPTYGSLQGADMCLKTKQCNDIDTASLLIALLRVSNIPARYRCGILERKIENFMNWMGGFTDPMAALNLAASAGIPVTGQLVGDQIKYARYEHVWVEGRVLYGPFRGAGGVDNIPTWIPLDASYKQYTYTKGIDIQTEVPFDAQAFVDQIQATAVINEEEGYATGIDSSYIQQTMQDYQAQVEAYINQNHPDATVGDVLGKKEIVKEEFPYLLGTLHNRTISKKWESPTLPNNLIHRITFNVTKDIYDTELGTPINITKTLPEIAGKKITLSYSPATQADEDVINSYIPQPHPDGTPIQPDELPTSLPAYMVNLKPELRIGGTIVATGTPITLGTNETFTMTFSGPTINDNDVITNEVKAGNYLGIAIDPSSISPEQMETLKTKLETTKAKLEAEDFTGLTKDDILGDLLYATALSYLAEYSVTNTVSAKTMGVLAITYPSETIFSYELKSNYAFGFPISVGSNGLAMDADRLMHLVKALDGDTEKPKRFMMTSGMNGSALEHSVPEQLFSTPENHVEGISSVKALQIANSQGIPVYIINRTNVDTIFPQLLLDAETKADIRNAVNAGKVVTTSKTEINYNGWTGCGYIITDPNTGAGAYMISGGMSGAWIGLIFLLIAGLFLLLSIFLFPLGIAALPVLIALLNLFFVNVLISLNFLYGVNAAREFGNCMWVGGPGSTVATQIARMWRIAADILDVIIAAIDIKTFGQCIADLLYN